MVMREEIETTVTPDIVWSAWEQAHALHGQKTIETGQKGSSQSERGRGFKYKVLEAIPGEEFSILWKTLFVRLIFTHTVKPTKRGSLICYHVKIKGLFAWPVRMMLGKKIKRNIGQVLKEIVHKLELENKTKPRHRTRS